MAQSEMKSRPAIRANRRTDKRVACECAVCGCEMKVILYADRTYRGGHYFGKIPLHSKTELRRALKAGSHAVSGHAFRVLNKDPKPYAYAEYWECPRCYWK